MARVADTSGNTPTDVSYTTYIRTNAGTPAGTLTPTYVGELVLDTTNSVMYRGVGTTANTLWEKITRTR